MGLNALAPGRRATKRAARAGDLETFAAIGIIVTAGGGFGNAAGRLARWPASAGKGS